MSLLHCLEKLIDSTFALLPRHRPTIETKKKIAINAHRGAHNHQMGFIENTMPAFSHALDLGCDGIEFDVHTTKDDVLVINHDATLQRIWRQNLTICETDYQTLHSQAPLVPTLKEVIETFGGRIHLFIELKAPLNKENAFFNLLAHLTPGEDYHLLSLDETLFEQLKLFPDDAMLLVAVHNNVKKFIQLCLEKGYGGVLGHSLLMTKQKISTLKQAQKLAGVGFVDSKNHLYREMHRGTQQIFTNHADEICAQLRALKKEQGI